MIRHVPREELTPEQSAECWGATEQAKDKEEDVFEGSSGGSEPYSQEAEAVVGPVRTILVRNGI